MAYKKVQNLTKNQRQNLIKSKSNKKSRRFKIKNKSKTTSSSAKLTHKRWYVKITLIHVWS